jgi:bacterioferritin (cytochrome b1)
MEDISEETRSSIARRSREDAERRANVEIKNLRADLAEAQERAATLKRALEEECARADEYAETINALEGHPQEVSVLIQRLQRDLEAAQVREQANLEWGEALNVLHDEVKSRLLTTEAWLKADAEDIDHVAMLESQNKKLRDALEEQLCHQHVRPHCSPWNCKICAAHAKVLKDPK